jgi:hypothetical protein
LSKHFAFTLSANIKALRRGRCSGGEDFRKQMLEQIEGKLGEPTSI